MSLRHRLNALLRRLRGRGTSAPARPMAWRVISLSMVKNEQDIIQPFIRHNARFVDCMIILDNASVDATRRIAVACARELGNVVVTDDAAFGYAQSERMTRMLHDCQPAFLADFVVFLDADEFISAPDRDTLIRILERIEPGGIGLMPWRNFVLTPDEAAAETRDPPRRMRHRRTVDDQVYFKAVLRADGAHRPDLFVVQGNHDILTTAFEALPTVRLDDLPLLHFPVRSREQLATKTIVGWAAYVAREPGARRGPHTLQWRDSFDRIVAGGMSPAELADLSLRYALPPMELDWKTDVVECDPPADYDRKFSSGASADPLAVIALSWERSLSDPSDTHDADSLVDAAAFRFIVEKYAPATVLGIGAGLDGYRTLFEGLGASLAQDVGAGGGVFDLVVCAAPAEARAIPDIDVLIDTITRHARATIVLMAACADGQPIAVWLARLAARGWHPALVDSLGMRALATLPWLRRTLIVLRAGDAQGGAGAAAVLTALDAKAVG